jgi:hypothetical protein
MVGGSLRVLRLPPSLKLVAMIIAEIFLKVALNTTNQITKIEAKYSVYIYAHSIYWLDGGTSIKHKPWRA